MFARIISLLKWYNIKAPHAINRTKQLNVDLLMLYVTSRFC